MGGAAAHGMVPHLLEEAWKWSLEVSKCYHCFMGLCIGLLFLLMTPVTHGVLGRKLHGASEWQLRKTTFRGGKRFVLLQAISWAAWSTSLIALMAAAVVVLNAYAHAELPSPVLSGAAVCGAVLSEVVQVCSLLFFQEYSEAAPATADGAAAGEGWSRGGQSTAGVHRLRNHRGAAVVIVLGVVLSLTGHGLVASVALDAVAGTPARLLFTSIAAVCIVISAPLTHGLAGRLRHRKDSWQFFNPGRGGVAFVAMQAVGWALYSLSLFAFLAAFAIILDALSGHHLGTHASIPFAFWFAGASGVAAQVVLSVSLVAYAPDEDRTGRGLKERPPPDFWMDFWMVVVLIMVYAPCHMLVIGIASLFLALPTPAASSIVLCSALLYSQTYVGDPGHSGSRTWAAFQERCANLLSLALSRWFVTVRVIREEPAPPKKAEQVMFGYHPHGLIPAAAAWFHHTPQWRERFPETRPVTLGASAIFLAPVLRDVVMWSGARTVSRRSMARALAEGHSIVLCPGGQAELVEHEEGNTTVLCTHHKGFIRMAIEAGAAVCPVFVFGEAQAQRNLLPWKSLQRWTIRKLGFPVPFVPTGYLGISPLPQPIPLTFVCGPHIPTGPRPGGRSGEATAEEIDAVHEKYYAAIKDIFERHKADAGYPNAQLILK